MKINASVSELRTLKKEKCFSWIKLKHGRKKEIVKEKEIFDKSDMNDTKNALKKIDRSKNGWEGKNYNGPV